jgi:hypothetical protein
MEAEKRTTWGGVARLAAITVISCAAAAMLSKYVIHATIVIGPS